MDVLVLGAGGMLGRKLAAALAAGALGKVALTLADVVAPQGTAGVRTRAADLAAPGAMAGLVAGRPAVIFHLAAVVSAEAEADLARGYAVNLDATRALVEAIRALPGYRPRVVFASSTAVFGTPLPDLIGDDFHLTPRSSYGTQKAMGELLLADYSRRGFVDAIALRLPTICIRPGAPNRAASGFYSSILREPLAGRRAVLPVPDSTRHWFASPRAATGFFLRAARLDTAALGGLTAINMPGLSATVDEMIAALQAVAPGAERLIDRVPDDGIAAIVNTWPRGFHTARARALGFAAEASFDEIIRVYLEDDAPKA